MSFLTSNLLSKTTVSKRFHIKGIPKSWVKNTDETSWRLFEYLSRYILINNISVFDSKYNVKMRFGILEVMRECDAQKLIELTDDKDRFYLPVDKFYITIRKFTELPPKSTVARLNYSREDILALRKLSVNPPKILTCIYSSIKKMK